MKEEHPCNLCEHNTDCLNCVFGVDKTAECCNFNCMHNYETGCLLSFDKVCRASTCYEADEDDIEEDGGDKHD